MPDKWQYETVKFVFGEEHLRELGQSLARETQSVYDLKKRKKEVDADMAAAIEAANGRVEILTTKINNGYEMREVEVLHVFDEPRAGMKRIVRIDSNEIIRVLLFGRHRLFAACFRKLADIPESAKPELHRIIVCLLVHDIEPKFYQHDDFHRVYVHIRHLHKARHVLRSVFAPEAAS